MGEPRKIFRIEEMTAARRDIRSDDPGVPPLAGIMDELGALRAMLAPPALSRSAASALPGDVERLAARLRHVRAAITGTAQEPAGTDDPRAALASARIAQELDAVTQGSEQATQKILAAAEEIDQAANTLSATLKDDAGHGLTQDIRDRVIAIFEACNYQDLTSQRVAKVMATLDRLERQIAETLADLDPTPPAHGPLLEGDAGHVTQSDIDSMFAC